MTSLTPEALYVQLGQLIAETPDFLSSPAPTDEKRKWLARAVALVEASGNVHDSVDALALASATQYMEFGDADVRRAQVTKIMQIMYRALARAELKAPVAAQGAFIPAGNPYDAFAAVGKVLGKATVDVLIVDPYADGKLLEHYALQTPEQVSLRVLADQQSHKATLKPAAAETTAYALGQSFNKLAERSPTSLVRSDPETAALKIAAYENLWQSAQPL